MVIAYIMLTVAFAIFISAMYFKLRDNSIEKMSFKESLDLADLPIITFYNNNKKINLLLDTGANLSIINKGVLPQYTHTEIEGSGTTSGIDGVSREVSFASLNLYYGDKKFEETFQVLDMQSAIDKIKTTTGVTMMGILGNNFFKKYRYVLDFDKLIAYSKDGKYNKTK